MWGSATLAKATLQKLFFHGRLLISGRQSNRRLYDLPHRVLPPRDTRATGEPAPPDVAPGGLLTRLRQHRLVAPQEGGARRSWRDLVERVKVEGCPPLHCLRSDMPLLGTSGRGALRSTAAHGTRWTR